MPCSPTAGGCTCSTARSTSSPRRSAILRACRRAYRQAAARFATILAELVEELRVAAPADRRGAACRSQGVVARRMAAAVWPHRATFITPMAAVAGAVADEVLAAMVRRLSAREGLCQQRRRHRLASRAGRARCAPASSPTRTLPAIDATVELRHDMPVRGIATSGWRGRSCSLGIADAVTVLAATAAEADAAATLIANAVDCDHPGDPPHARQPLARRHGSRRSSGHGRRSGRCRTPGRRGARAGRRARRGHARGGPDLCREPRCCKASNRMVQPAMPWRAAMAARSSHHPTSSGRTPCSIAEASWR